MGFTMQGWQTTFLGLRELPRDISDFEVQAFFTFDGAEREATNARRGGANKAAMDEINARGEMPIIVRQVKYLNNIVESLLTCR